MCENRYLGTASLTWEVTNGLVEATITNGIDLSVTRVFHGDHVSQSMIDAMRSLAEYFELEIK